MKSLLKLIFPIFAIILIFSSCKTDTQSANSNAGINTAELKGQSGVVDEESERNILQIAISSADHSTLVAGVVATGLQDVLTNAGPLTVFAPNNAAFDALPEGTLDNLLKKENLATLKNIITFHAAPGSYTGNNIKGVMGIGQATGDKVKVETIDGVTYVNGAKILGTVKASNGYVHVIDKVLLPPEEN